MIQAIEKVLNDESEGCIVCGDCLEVMADMPDGCVDAVVTDPPWGIQLTHKQHKWFRQEGEGYKLLTDTPEEVLRVTVPAVALAIRKFGRVVVMLGIRCMYDYPRPRDIGGIFNSAGAGMGPWGFSCVNPILYYGKDPYLVARKGSRPTGWRQPVNDFAAKVEHPCPKPIGLMCWLVECASMPDHIILDPFCGSGTTCVAAKKLGRRYIGIEIDEGYCDIARDRLLQLDGKRLGKLHKHHGFFDE